MEQNNRERSARPKFVFKRTTKFKKKSKAIIFMIASKIFRINLTDLVQIICTLEKKQKNKILLD